MEIPKEWLSGLKIISADLVRKLPPGSRVRVHTCYGRAGERVWQDCTVIQWGKKRRLGAYTYDGWITLEIKARENVAYELLTD